MIAQFPRESEKKKPSLMNDIFRGPLVHLGAQVVLFPRPPRSRLPAALSPGAGRRPDARALPRPGREWGLEAAGSLGLDSDDAGVLAEAVELAGRT